MITLGGMTLSQDLLWENEFEPPLAVQNLKRTLGGKLIVQTGVLVSGREVKLTAYRSGNEFSGFFTREQLDTIRGYEQSGAIIEFVYGATSLFVKVNPGGVQVQPLIPSSEVKSTDLFTGTINLLEMGGN